MTDNIDLDKNIEEDVKKTLREVAEKDSIVQTWENKKYGDIQRITNPKKGDLGEKLIKKWLEMFEYPCEIRGRIRKRGGNNIDLLVDLNKDNKKERVEVKLASLDVSGKYQFNWIPIQSDYILIFFIGINPDAIYLSIKTKKDIIHYVENPTLGKTLTPVPTADSSTHRKWTTSAEHADMVEIKTYRDIKKILNEAISECIANKNL